MARTIAFRHKYLYRRLPTRVYSISNANPILRPEGINYSKRLRSVSAFPRQSVLSMYEDRRYYHPDGFNRPVRRFGGRRVSLVAQPRRKEFVPSGIRFYPSSQVLICVRRKQRKEVLHAMRKTGKAGQRSPRRNQWSDVYC